ncbi:hypothetical protein U1769_02055 [Sphingomonas sp. ZT3P38]|uniref:hypothetical protein n=1 Tax=Parasphingomonas zepuensis TaxID=3096161 RepID=UPI002FCAF73B
MILALLHVLRKWVEGMADRRRAENEGQSAEDRAAGEARAQLFMQMQQQLKVMSEEIGRLKLRIEEVEAQNRLYLTELIELRATAQAEVRTRQLVQAVDSPLDGQGRP